MLKIKNLLLISIVFIMPFISYCQFNLTSNHVKKAYKEIKMSANYPDTWQLINYGIYKNKISRKCLSLAIIEIKAKNAFNTPIRTNFMLYFLNGELFYWLENKYKVSFLDYMNPSDVDGLMEIAIEGGIYERRTIREEQICKTDKEIEEQRRMEKERIEKERIEKERIEKERKLKQDEEFISRIEEELMNDNPEKSAIIYSYINFKNSHDEVKVNIQKALELKYGQEIVSIKEYIIQRDIITPDNYKNLSYLLNASTKEYKCECRKENKYITECVGLNSDSEPQKLDLKYKKNFIDHYLKENFSDFTIEKKITFNLISESKTIENKRTYEANYNKPIYFDGKDYYKKQYPNSKGVEYKLNEELYKKTIIQTIYYSDKIIINGSEIKSTDRIEKDDYKSILSKPIK